MKRIVNAEMGKSEDQRPDGRMCSEETSRKLQQKTWAVTDGGRLCWPHASATPREAKSSKPSSSTFLIPVFQFQEALAPSLFCGDLLNPKHFNNVRFWRRLIFFS